jgi:multimeric flavodoxin WrbA
MKILVVQGSPKGAHGNTEVLVKAFLGGAKVAGAKDAEIVYLKDKHIKHCSGCFTCWTRTPGICIHHDDMPELLLKIRDADILVLATPLYFYTVSGLMKDFMDRTLPLEQPFMEKSGDVYHHPPRYTSALKHLVVISNCGFPEQSRFSGLKETFRAIVRDNDSGLKGMICCAGGPLLTGTDAHGASQWYLDAVKQSGIEVVRDGEISPETTAILERPLADSLSYVQHINEHWQSLGVERVSAGN